MSSNNNSGSNVADDIYGGAASFGKFMGMINVVVLGLLSLICFIAGLVFLSKKEVYTKKVMASILNLTTEPCQLQEKVVNDSKNSRIVRYFRCKLQLSYKVENDSFNQDLWIDSDDNYNNSTNNQIEISYNPSNPTDIAYKPVSPKTIGSGLLFVALILSIMAIVTYYIITKFKFAAAGVGAVSVFRWFR